jgi:hypothetical protein
MRLRLAEVYLAEKLAKSFEDIGKEAGALH